MMLELNKILNTIICDDCLKVMKQIPDKSIDLVLTDPPYGTTQLDWDKVPDLDILWTELKRIGKDTCAYIFTATQPFTSQLVISNIGWYRYELIWEKSRMTDFFQSTFKPMKTHENIEVFYKKLPTFNPIKWKIADRFMDRRKTFKEHEETGQFKGNKKIHKIDDGSRNPCSVLSFESINTESESHSTQKPIPLFEYLIKTYSNENDTILDPFLGSGTTAVACKQLKRNFIGIEISEKYCETARQRLRQEVLL